MTFVPERLRIGLLAVALLVTILLIFGAGWYEIVLGSVAVMAATLAGNRKRLIPIPVTVDRR